MKVYLIHSSHGVRKVLWLLMLGFVSACSVADSNSGVEQPVPVGTAPDGEQFVSQDEFNELMQQVSNWSRWGADDQLGTLNLITSQKRVDAAAMVDKGVVVSMAHTLRTKVAADNPTPFEHEIHMDEFGKTGVVTDHYAISYHGTGHSHLDALGHVYHNGKQYNGVGEDAVSSQGIARNSIHVMKQGIVTRGLLLDMPALRNVQQLQAGDKLSDTDLERWTREGKIRVNAGDALFVRFGRWQGGVGESIDLSRGIPGLELSAVRWLKDRDIAVLGTDLVADAIPSGVEGELFPVHKLLITAMGMPLMDNLDLEQLASEVNRQQRVDFMFVVSPLVVKGGSGSPVNPLAIF